MLAIIKASEKFKMVHKILTMDFRECFDLSYINGGINLKKC